MLEADGVADSAAALESSLQLGAGAEGAAEGAAGSAAAAGLDAFGRAVVACLAQLAVTAGSDAQWKPLNHQVTACALCGVVPWGWHWLGSDLHGMRCASAIPAAPPFLRPHTHLTFCPT